MARPWWQNPERDRSPSPSPCHRHPWRALPSPPLPPGPCCSARKGLFPLLQPAPGCCHRTQGRTEATRPGASPGGDRPRTAVGTDASPWPHEGVKQSQGACPAPQPAPLIAPCKNSPVLARPLQREGGERRNCRNRSQMGHSLIPGLALARSRLRGRPALPSPGPVSFPGSQQYFCLSTSSSWQQMLCSSAGGAAGHLHARPGSPWASFTLG